MNILNELTKNFQYSENLVNPDMRKVTSGPFRDVLVNRNGICYSRSGKAMSISKTGVYGSLNDRHSHAIHPWRLCALVWHDQSPSLHLINSEKDKNKYLNLLAFIKVLEKYPDEYELLMNGLKTNYYPLSRGKIFNVLTGTIGASTHNFKIRHPDKYEKINWSYFEEIGNKIKTDFQKFKNELSEELEENLKNVSTPKTDTVEIVEPEPKEEFEVCLSDPELGGAPSLKPKVKSISKENKMEYCSEREKEIDKLIKKLVKAAEKHNTCDVFHFTNELRRMGLTEKEIGDRSASALGIFPLPSSINRVEYDPTVIISKMEVQEQEVQVDNKASASIDELQELFDRRAQLKKELDKVEKEIVKKTMAKFL